MKNQRRKVLIAAISSSGLLGSSRVFATAEEVEAAIKSIVGDAEITQGALTLIIPQIAENGFSVPVSVTVESAMTKDSYVESVTIFAEENPNPEAITFNFTENSGEVFAATRMRLASTQNVVAVAKLNDGTVFTDSRYVEVTIGGCGA